MPHAPSTAIAPARSEGERLSKAKIRESSDGADGGTRTHTPLRGADFLTTSAFAAAKKGVRGLDYPFALARWP
jgi:hypothetical protein